MKKYKLLVLTDHSRHSEHNSIYAILRAMRQHSRCAHIDVASRGLATNYLFFKNYSSDKLQASRVEENFDWYKDGRVFKNNLRGVSLQEYDAIFLRLPPPIPMKFWEFLWNNYPARQMINNPKGIVEAGSKKFLLHFPKLCPKMQLVESIEAIAELKKQFPIVLKPFYNYGGKGIVRIDGDKVWEVNQTTDFSNFAKKWNLKKMPYLAMEFLRHLDKGDKRIIVVNGQVMGASLRFPSEGSWICNIAQGGRALPAEIDADEQKILQYLDPVLAKMGIIMYGIDTLMGNEGKRVLSEINTTSIGGLAPLAKDTGKPLVREAGDLIWNYITTIVQ